MKAIITIMALAVLTATNIFAQNGSIKFSGHIVDEKNETQLTTITLYMVNKGSGEEMLTVGQDIIEGNRWFDVQLELGQQYVLNILSNNGEERILEFNTDVPADIAKNRMRHALKIDMTGADLDITHSFKNSSESQIAYSQTKQIGMVAFDQKAEAFIHNAYSDMQLTASR